MSKEPLIIKSTFFNMRPDKMEKVRKIIKKQMEEATPVVMLPCGFELAVVDVHLLEEIKAKIGNLISCDKYDAMEIIDVYINQLKGENNAE